MLLLFRIDRRCQPVNQGLPGRRLLAPASTAAVAPFVADNGPGFQPTLAQRPFEPFACLHADGLSHNGIGQSIVRRIAERHGCRVQAANATTGGAVFWPEIPGAR